MPDKHHAASTMIRSECVQLRHQHQRLHELANRLEATADDEERDLTLHLLQDAFEAHLQTRQTLSFGLQQMLGRPHNGEMRRCRVIGSALQQLLRALPGGSMYRSRAALLRDDLLRYIEQQEHALRQQTHVTA
jgi:hypothetical protein